MKELCEAGKEENQNGLQDLSFPDASSTHASDELTTNGKQASDEVAFSGGESVPEQVQVLKESQVAIEGQERSKGEGLKICEHFAQNYTLLGERPLATAGRS